VARAGSTSDMRASTRETAAFAELQRGDGDGGLREAAGAEAIAARHRLGRHHPSEAGDRGRARKREAIHIRDPSRSRHARIAPGAV